MLRPDPGVRIFLASQAVDLRKSFDGLAGLARDVLRQDPLSGHLFVFVNRAGNRVKALYWDRTGWAMLVKRLENARVRLPAVEGAALELDASQLLRVLDGIGWAHAARRTGTF